MCEQYVYKYFLLIRVCFSQCAARCNSMLRRGNPSCNALSVRNVTCLLGVYHEPCVLEEGDTAVVQLWRRVNEGKMRRGEIFF